MFMSIKLRKPQQFNNILASCCHAFNCRPVTIVQFVAVTLGLIFIVTLILKSSPQSAKIQASQGQENKHESSAELTNKRRLIVALQSLRMHNVTRYQRKSSSKLEQPLSRSAAEEEASDDLSRVTSSIMPNGEDLRAPPPFVVSVQPVQHGW